MRHWQSDTTEAMSNLTDADRLYIHDASLDELREELSYARRDGHRDEDWCLALASEILRRTKPSNLLRESQGQESL